MTREIAAREGRLRRHLRVRTRVTGTPERPRLCVFRSLNHIYAQVIDDRKGNTLVASSTLDSEIKKELAGKNKSAKSRLVGVLVARRALEKGVKKVVFDRGGRQYHGRVKALAEAAREAGLIF